MFADLYGVLIFYLPVKQKKGGRERGRGVQRLTVQNREGRGGTGEGVGLDEGLIFATFKIYLFYQRTERKAILR